MTTSPLGSLRVRPPGPADVGALRALRRHAGWDEELVERWLLDVVEGRKVLWLAETPEGEPAAMVALDLVDGDREVADGVSIAAVSALVVGPDHGRRGLGRALTRLAEDEARRRGFAWITLNTRPDNAAALALYEGLGYVRFKDALRPWGLAVYLRKPLAPPPA